MAQDRIRRQYEEIIRLPEEDKVSLGKLLAHESMCIPFMASRADYNVLAGTTSCRKAATYLVAGVGDLAWTDEVFLLQDRICFTPIPEMPLSGGTSRYVLLDCHYFVATPSDGQAVLLTTSAEKRKVEIQGPFHVRDAMDHSRDEVDIKITVKAFGLDGKAKTAKYHWQCLVEVGVFDDVPG
jgi:hypothetical protein